MWRLLGGELVWALRQLAARPWVGLGLAGGATATFAVLSAIAPGPVIDPPWRLLVAIAAGLVVAAGIRELERSLAKPTGTEHREDRDGELPLIGAAEVAAGATVAVLIVWLAVWAARSLPA